MIRSTSTCEWQIGRPLNDLEAHLGYVDERIGVKFSGSTFPLIVQIVLYHEVRAQTRLSILFNALASKTFLPLRTTAVGQGRQLSVMNAL